MINLLNYFRSRRAAADSTAAGTARQAKERLQILVARDRSGIGRRDYMPALQEEILEVIRKYVEVDRDAVQIQFDRHDDCEILEVNVTLPEPDAATNEGKEQRNQF